MKQHSHSKDPLVEFLVFWPKNIEVTTNTNTFKCSFPNNNIISPFKTSATFSCQTFFISCENNHESIYYCNLNYPTSATVRPWCCSASGRRSSHRQHPANVRRRLLREEAPPPAGGSSSSSRFLIAASHIYRNENSQVSGDK